MISGIAELGPVASSQAAGLLRFYWFRIADFGVPAALALAIGLVLNKWLLFGPRKYHRLMPWIAGALIAAASIVITIDFGPCARRLLVEAPMPMTRPRWP